MVPLNKRWKTAPRLPAEVDKSLHGYPAILRQILFNRGYATPELASQFLEAKQPPGTDPYNMLGMSEAVNRIERAILHSEKIIIYGDYDVDGVTATALMVEALRSLGSRVDGYIPNRFDEGYGLNIEALENLKDQGADLIVTVDCGVRSLEESDYARQLDLDLIISDHHHPGKELPTARAIINPLQPGDEYPEKDLAGVGLAYKLTSALIDRLKSQGKTSANSLSPELLLDLVALGTVADLAPLIGENRTLVRAGIKNLRETRHLGVRSLIRVSGLQQEKIKASHIGFVLGPRLNAAGRLDTALDALTLITTSDLAEAGLLAQRLELQNRERQKITRQTQEQAEQLALAEDPNPWLLFAAHPEFNPGVVGLAASRLTESYYRPAIVAQVGKEYTRASCRSIPEFHITEALDQCADLLLHHGGHAAAAGFTVSNRHLSEVVRQLRSIARQKLSEIDLRPTLFADAEIQLSDLNPEIIDYLDWLQPTGYGNRQALFISRDLRVSSSRAVGKDQSHLKMSVTDGWITWDAIAFRQGHWQENLPPMVDLIYNFEANEYMGRTTLQLNVRDLKPTNQIK